MATTPFVVVPSLAAIAVGYKQSGLIADMVLPRVPVNTPTFRYLKYSAGDEFMAPDTRVSRKGAPNQVDWGTSEISASVNDEGLDTPVPNADIQAWEGARAAGGGFVSQVDPLSRNTALVMQTVQNRREFRAANLVFNGNSYGTANKVTLSGTGQWSDFVNSDPLSTVMGYLDTMIMRPNIAVFGRATATRLSLHPKICKAVFGNNTDAGVAPMSAIANLLGLEAIYIGDAWVNTAAPGQPAVMGRAWGKHASFMYRNMQADTQGGITFGLTAQWGSQIAGTIVDSDIGLRGGQRVRAGESVLELITANDLGYLVQNAVA
jgi:hypothetical protein